MKRMGLGFFIIVLVMSMSLGSLAAPVEIDFFFVANESEADAWYELAELFNASQDEVYVHANWDVGEWVGYQERMLVRIASGLSPDIIRLSDEAFPEWAAAGYLQPADMFLERDVDLSNFLPPVVSMGTHNGVFYGFPQGIATRALAYNKNSFDEVGLPYPTDDWRWDVELLEASRALTSRNAEDLPLTYGIGFFWGGAGNLRKDIPEILWAFGGEVFDEDGQFRLGDEESLQALSFMQSLVAEYRVYPEDFDIVGRFLNHSLAMWNTGVWDVNLLRQQTDMDWDFAPTPGGPAGHYSFIQGNGVYVMPTGGNADAAWKFMKFLAGEEAQRIFGLEYGIGGIPLQASLVPDYVAQPAPPENWEAFVTSINRGRIVHHPADAGRIFNALNQGWPEMSRGETPVRVWFDSVAPVVQSIIEGN